MGRLESAHQMPAQVVWFDSVTIFTTAIDARDLLDTSEECSPSKQRRHPLSFSASLFGLVSYGYTKGNGHISLTCSTINSLPTSQISTRIKLTHLLSSLRKRLQRKDLIYNIMTSASKSPHFPPSVWRSQHAKYGAFYPETPGACTTPD
jgi:hypothetical protein